MIRPFSLRDAPVILHLQTRAAAFDLKRRLLSSSSPTRSAVLGLVSGHRIGSRTLVHAEAPAAAANGYIEVLPRDDGLAWDVFSVAPALGQDESSARVWQALLVSVMASAAAHCVARIYARLPVDDEAVWLLRRSGFTPIGCEEIFVNTTRPGPAAMPAGMRRVSDGDEYALSELRRQVIPPLVYQAQWSGSEDLTAARHTLDGYVWVEEGRILAHLSQESTGRGHWIECTVRPDRRGDVLPFLRYLLHTAAGDGSRPIYVCVPDYTVGVGWLLRTLGYSSLGRQQVMVAPTVSRVTVTRPAVAHGLEGRADIVAQ